MQIVQINILSLQERISQLKALKESWETTGLEQCQIRFSGASADALKRVMDEYEQLRVDLIKLIDATLNVVQNTKETFKGMDDSLAASMIGAAAAAVGLRNSKTDTAIGLGKVAAEVAQKGPLHTGNNHPVPNTAIGTAKEAVEAVLNGTLHTGNNHPVSEPVIEVVKDALDEFLK